MEQPDILYRKYSKNIFNLAYRMTGSMEEASDITQETFIQAFLSIDKFRGESQMQTWLYRIAKNVSLKFLDKRKKTSFASLQELIYKVESPVSEEISETDRQLYINQIKDGCLSGLLRCLPLQQRLVFILHVLLDIPLIEVAQIINKSENAARILVHRSKQNIKEFLCRNCSLYSPTNSCHCPNMINFSLKQGWIGMHSPIRISQAETEIKNIKAEILLYKSLQTLEPTHELHSEIKQLISDRKNFVIFQDKKVK